MENPEYAPAQSVDFEEFATENGSTWWCARWLMQRLGYSDWRSFQGVINKAIGSCMQLGVSVDETMKQYTREDGDSGVISFKLNRFGCYLIVMHADRKKPEVNALIAYLAAFAARLADAAESDEALHRLELREKLKDGESLMSGVAAGAGVHGADMAIFKDAGYRGMYNMSRTELVRRRGLKKSDILYDYMGTVELAAHNYRVTQTAERIRTRNIRGLDKASAAAREVGAKVRNDMMENTGVLPEHLKVEGDIRKLKSQFKKANKDMLKGDGSKRKRLKGS